MERARVGRGHAGAGGHDATSAWNLIGGTELMDILITEDLHGDALDALNFVNFPVPER